MKAFKLKYQDGLSELDYLEQIYKKVRLHEIVKFNGKVYMRVTPRNNKFYKSPYHFCLLVRDIYQGNILTLDDDGEHVNSVCHYKIEIIN